MGQTIYSKGKDIREAIQIGLDILGIDKDEASIEVIRQESRGFLNLVPKPAVVKLTKLTRTQSHQEKNHTNEKHLPIQDSVEALIDNFYLEGVSQEAHHDEVLKTGDKTFLKENLEGKVWVENGQIFCKPSMLHYPTITVGKGLKLLKNHKPVEGTTVATEVDQFEIQTVEEVTETKVDITMDSNKLNVFLHVQPGMRRTYRIKDIDPEDHINLEAEEIVEVKNELDYKEILTRLEELRVIHGFNHSEIMDAVNTEKAGEFLIANGIKPQEGKNGNLEILIDIDKKIGPQERKDGTVDFREVKVIPTVQKGQVIGVIQPPVPGIPGSTVTNEPLPPKPTYPLIVQIGKGITLIENDSKIVATETGRPVIEQKGLMVKVSIIPKLVHPGNVNMISGNIRFKGDIDILGNIEEGMVVEAEGNVAVVQNVYSSTVSSRSTISIKGTTIGSKITAGRQNIYTSELVYLLTTIKKQLEMMILSIEQLTNLQAFKMTDYGQKGLRPLLKILLEKKFRLLLTTTKQFIELSNKGSHFLNLEWINLAEQLNLCILSSVTNEYHTIERLYAFQKEIKQVVEKYNEEKDEECSVNLNYAHNSTIYSGGDVVIQGKGCYNSKIHAGRNLIIDGVFRGGEVYARLEATIKECGSPGGAVSKITVPSNGKIKIDLAREGAVIQIGKAKYTFQKEQRFITAKLDANENIVFSF